MLSTLEKTGVDSALLVDAVETVCFVTVEEGMYGDLLSGKNPHGIYTRSA